LRRRPAGDVVDPRRGKSARDEFIQRGSMMAVRRSAVRSARFDGGFGEGAFAKAGFGALTAATLLPLSPMAGFFPRVGHWPTSTGLPLRFQILFACSTWIKYD